VPHQVAQPVFDTWRNDSRRLPPGHGGARRLEVGRRLAEEVRSPTGRLGSLPHATS
jgi:hypothetical protein